MDISKQYHFYAAHRNIELHDKCSFLHGHTYYLTVVIDAPRKPDSSISEPFSAIDDVVQPLIDTLDHSVLVDQGDFALNLLISMDHGEDVFGKRVELPFPTSCENLCYWIFSWLQEMAPFKVTSIRLKETVTSEICYSIYDYNVDRKTFVACTH